MMPQLKDKALVSPSSVEQEGAAKVPAIIPPRPLGFPAKVAEFLLVLRMRVYRRSLSFKGGIMQSAANILLVTCKSWFGAKGEKGAKDVKVSKDAPERDSHKP